MSVLDDLERSLARAVDAGAASAPQTRAEAARRTGLGRLGQRRRWHVFLALVAAGGVTTGALAATGNLPIVQIGDRTSDPNYAVMPLPWMDYKPKEPPTILPMRVRDPQGGPPWALRTFPIGRGKRCAQAGQLYQGKFGLVTQVVDRVAAPKATGPAPATTVFQELPAAAGMAGVRCGTTRPGDLLIAANRQATPIYPDGTDLRCRNNPTPLDVAPCTITAVTVLRWGFLGPRAQTATFVQPGGRRGPTQPLDPQTGGAYLFAQSVDPAPFRASQRFERELRSEAEQRAAARRGGLPASRAERNAADIQALIREMRAISREARGQRRDHWRAQQAEAVDATFAGAAPRRVAGPGAKGGPLPGVAPVVNTVPKVGRAPINVTFRGRERAVEVRFGSPVPLDARPGLYAVSIRGPQTKQRSCGKPGSSQAEWGREVAAGDALLIRVRPSPGKPGRRLPAWCAGARYDVRVRHVVRDPYKPGLLSEQLVGTTSFVAD